MKIEVPTKEDWEEYYSDMDQRDAYKVFFGRTNKEVQDEYAKHITARTTDLKFMPKIPFCYYMIGFNDFVINGLFDKGDAPDVANCFITLVEDKLKNNPDHILPIMEKLLGTLEYIANHQGDYGASIRIYGDFREKLASIKASVARSP